MVTSQTLKDTSNILQPVFLQQIRRKIKMRRKLILQLFCNPFSCQPLENITKSMLFRPLMVMKVLMNMNSDKEFEIGFSETKKPLMNAALNVK